MIQVTVDINVRYFHLWPLKCWIQCLKVGKGRWKFSLLTAKLVDGQLVTRMSKLHD